MGELEKKLGLSEPLHYCKECKFVDICMYAITYSQFVDSLHNFVTNAPEFVNVYVTCIYKAQLDKRPFPTLVHKEKDEKKT